MEATIASILTDAFALKIHPRMDFRTDEGRTFTMRMAPFLSSLIRPGMRALDLGSSFGKSSMLLSELGAHVIGVDVSYRALRFSLAMGRSIDARTGFVRADYSYLPFRTGMFDLTLFPHNVVECSPAEFRTVVSETHRVLANGGVFAISVSGKWADPDKAEPELHNGTVTIPGIGTFPYPTYSWSAEAVRQAVSPFLPVKSVADIPERAGTWMVFCKTND